MAKMSQVSFWFWTMFFVLGTLFFSYITALNIAILIVDLIFLKDLSGVIIQGVAAGFGFVVVMRFIEALMEKWHGE